MKRLPASLTLALSVLAQTADAQTPGSKAARQTAQRVVPKVLEALAQRDFGKLASFVGEGGLALSPYVMLDDSDVRLSRSEVGLCSTDLQVRYWGDRDGSGSAIEMTCSRYFDEFVWTADYRDADEVLYDEPRQRGSEINSNHEFAPDGIVVEMHIRGEGDGAAMNWKSLRLIFPEGDQGLNLIAITRDVWTI